MVKLYTIKGENKTIRVFILEKATRIMKKSKEISSTSVVVQDWNTGETAVRKRNKLIFSQEVN